jgi:hypothetical protein
MAITFWRNVMRKITTQEMDASFDTLVDMIDNAGLSSEMPEGQIYIGDNTNTASLETLDKTLVGLPNVDNTSDLNKPISTAQMTSNSTGIKTGGVLSIGTGGAGVATTFTIAAGVGLVVDNTVTPATLTTVTWSAKTDVAVTNIGTQPLTFIAIDASGNVIQQATDFTGLYHRQYIVIGSVIHTNLTTVTSVNQGQHLAISPQSQLNDLFQSLAGFNISGNIFSANGTNLNINKSSGEIFKQGANYSTSANNPNIVSTASLTAATFRYNNQTGNASGIVSAIDPNNYDLAGVTTAVSVNKFTIQRVFLFSSNLLAIQRGQYEYNSLAEAKAAIQVESFVVNPSIIPNGVLRAFLIVRQGATALNSVTNAFFLEAPKFGGTAGVGGLSVSTLQNAYDNSLSPEILTDTTRGALSIKRGSAADTDTIFEVVNGAGIVTSSIDGNGLIYSGQATVSTPSFFDSAKKLISTTAQLWGTWVQTWASKATPVDADTIGFHDSATTFVGVKSTLLNFWTTYLLPKVQALGYLSAYTIPNYYKVNLNTGSDVTGVAGRTDKPYATLQAVWDLIAIGSTANILIEIEGEYTFTTHAVYTSIVKNNITFTFLNDIIYNVNSTTTSRPLFTFENVCNNLTFNCPTFTMTKQGGFLVMGGISSSANINFNTVNALMGIDTSTTLNVNLVRTVASGVFNCNNLNVSVTNDSNSIKGAISLFGGNTNMIYNIGIVTYSGAPTVASTSISLFGSSHGIINIKKFISSITTYTNISAFGFDTSLNCSVVNIDEVTIASSSSIKTYGFLNPSVTTIQYNIKKLSLLNTQTLINGSSVLNFGYFEYNGYLSYGNTFNGTLNFEYIKCTATATEGYLSLKSNTKINGVGRGVWEYTPTTFLSNTMALLVTFSGCNARISNVTFYGSGMQTADVNSFVPIRFNTGAKLRLDNVIFTTNLDTNSNANTTPIRAQAENAAYTCTIEGNFSTNYLLNVTGLTNNCEVDLITGYIV